LALINGRVRRDKEFTPDAATVATLGPWWAKYAERSQLFVNEGDGRFRDISRHNDPFCRTPGVGRGLAWGDVDEDGGVDLVVTSVAGPARLYRNVAPKRGHWLLVRALDPALHRDAYRRRDLRPGWATVLAGANQPRFSFLCSNDPRAHFGLGAAAQVDALQVFGRMEPRRPFRDALQTERSYFARGRADVSASEPRCETTTAPDRTARRWYRSPRLYVVASACCLLLGGGLYLGFARKGPLPPELDLSGIDPPSLQPWKKRTHVFGSRRAHLRPGASSAWSLLSMIPASGQLLFG